MCWNSPGHFSVSNAQTKAANYAAMIPALVQADKSVSGTNQWRMQRSLLQAFPLLPVFPPLSQVFFPLNTLPSLKTPPTCALVDGEVDVWGAMLINSCATCRST